MSPILFYLFLPFSFLRIFLESIIYSISHTQVAFYALNGSKLFPVDLKPKYSCSGLAGWSCTDVGNFSSWMAIIIATVALITPFIIFKKPYKKRNIFIVWYLTSYIGFLLFIFLTKFIFPEPMI